MNIDVPDCLRACWSGAYPIICRNSSLVLGSHDAHRRCFSTRRMEVSAQRRHTHGYSHSRASRTVHRHLSSVRHRSVERDASMCVMLHPGSGMYSTVGYPGRLPRWTGRYVHLSRMPASCLRIVSNNLSCMPGSCLRIVSNTLLHAGQAVCAEQCLLVHDGHAECAEQCLLAHERTALCAEQCPPVHGRTALCAEQAPSVQGQQHSAQSRHSPCMDGHHSAQSSAGMCM